MTDYKKRLQNLRDRRLGLDGGSIAFLDAQHMAKALSMSEAYESRTTSEAIRYALGSMQEVDAEYTRISIEEGERVRAQLESGLPGEGVAAHFDYQGSVPLNIHIRGTSDIDLLVLHAEFLVYDGLGVRAHSYCPLNINCLLEMIGLRKACEAVLTRRYYAANVDVSGGKSIALTGGSFRRKVDVVPAHWDDTADYQASGQKHDRQIWILDNDVPERVSNRPFLHMKRIEDRNIDTQGSAKKVIRLLKNLRKDADPEINLNSYDIASLVWNFDRNELNQPPYAEVALVAVAQSNLQALVANRAITETLVVPDGSRRVIDSPEKFSALQSLSQEVDQLAFDMVATVNPLSLLSRRTMRESLFGVRL